MDLIIRWGFCDFPACFVVLLFPKIICARSHLFVSFNKSILRCVCESVCVQPPLTMRSESQGPICGLPPESLERATEASNYPWPSGSLCSLPPAPGPAGSPRSLPSPRSPFSPYLPPSHVQNNPNAWLQTLIVAISETKTACGARQSRRSVKERGSDNTCMSVEEAVFEGSDGSDSLFQGDLFLEERTSSQWANQVSGIPEIVI